MTWSNGPAALGPSRKASAGACGQQNQGGTMTPALPLNGTEAAGPRQLPGEWKVGSERVRDPDPGRELIGCAEPARHRASGRVAYQPIEAVEHGRAPSVGPVIRERGPEAD